MTSFIVSAAEVKIPDLLVTGNPNAGSKLVSTCAACHGANGQSISSDWPNLAGQNQRYISEQLKYFQQGERENILMMAVIPYLKTLSDTQLLDIAAFYSLKPAAVGQAEDDKELLAFGESLYRAGDLSRGFASFSRLDLFLLRYKKVHSFYKIYLLFILHTERRLLVLEKNWHEVIIGEKLQNNQ